MNSCVGPLRRALATVSTVAVAALSACASDRMPADGGPLVLTRSDVHVLGSSEVIGQVRDLEPLPDGSVWLLNSGEPFFVGFDAGGGLIGAHGSIGGGPEEFRMPAGLVVGGLDGDAWTFDFIRHAFLRVSRPDEPWSELTIPRDEIPPGTVRGGMSLISRTVRTGRLGDEIIFPWTAGTMESGVAAYHTSLLRADLSALDVRTGLVRDVLGLGDVLEDPSVGFVATDGGFPLWYRLWAVCGREVRVYDRVRNELRGFTSDGQEVGPVEVPPVRFNEVTPLQFARAVFPLRQAEVTGAVGSRLTSEDSVRVLNRMAQSLEGKPQELAAYLPRYVDFRCSEDGTMWMQPIDLELGALRGGPLWLRITAVGETREVHMPERFDPLRFTPDRIWGVQRDELDVASVAWIELTGGVA
jgi:hypothetical protein